MLEQLEVGMAFAVVMLFLSLIVTVLVQSISALLDLRGKNLAHAVTKLLEQASADLKPHAALIADKLVKHPAVATGWRWGGARAKALRADELVRLLETFAADGDATLAGDQAAQNAQDAKVALKKLVESTVPGATPERLQAIAKAANDAARLFPSQAAAVQRAFEEGAQKALREAAQTTRELAQRVNAWFDTIMDRSSDRFAIHAKAWTAGFSFALALGFHIDAFGLLQQIRSDPALRTQLVQAAEGLQATAEEVLGDQPARQALQALVAKQQLASDKAAALEARLGRFDGCRQAQRLLREPDGAPEAADAFGTECQAAALKLLEQLQPRLGQVLDEPGLQPLRLFADPFPLWRGWWGLLGTLITAALLSLGAPFWFNTLRQLSNLRPILAGKVEQRAAGRS